MKLYCTNWANRKVFKAVYLEIEPLLSGRFFRDVPFGEKFSHSVKRWDTIPSQRQLLNPYMQP